MKTLIGKMSILAIAGLLMGSFSFAEIGNENTGYDSENNATIESENKAELDVENDTHLNNSLDGILKTGENHSSYNTGHGMVDSGDADAHVAFGNRANESSVSLGGSGMSMNIPTVMNNTTGARSENNSWIEFENKLEVDVENNAHVCNDIAVMTSTGGNKSNYNTGNGSVSTGDASLKVDVSNTLNTSEVTVH